MGFNRKQFFVDKRVHTFASLKTKAPQWIHAKVKNFTCHAYKSKTGELMQKWIPVYNIPEGYNNPLDSDVLFDHHKHCQLCDTGIDVFGVILHEEKKEFLIVGMECYQIYESDSDKLLKLKLLADCKAEWLEKTMNEEKAKIKNLLTIAETKIANEGGNSNGYGNGYSYGFYSGNYNLYSCIKRDRWLAWSKTKFNNFLVKNAVFFHKLGYSPNENLGMKQYIDFKRTALKHKIWKGFEQFAVNLRDQKIDKAVIESSYRLRNYPFNHVYKMVNGMEFSLSNQYYNVVKKMKELDIDKVNSLLDGDGFEKKIRPEDWMIKTVEQSIY